MSGSLITAEMPSRKLSVTVQAIQRDGPRSQYRYFDSTVL